MSSISSSNLTKRRRIVGVSTKMYFTLSKTQTYTTSFITSLRRYQSQQSDQSSTSKLKEIDIFIIPDFISLTSTVSSLSAYNNDTGSESGIELWTGAQDTHHEDYGAFTGEVSPAVLAEAGVKIVELGHAERRRFFGETDEIAAKKASAVSRNGMIPLVCIGEQTQGEVEVAVKECKTQILSVLDAVSKEDEVVFAYEPVWAIGAKEPASAKHVVDVVKGLRHIAQEMERTGQVRFLYGGSAGPGLFEKLTEGVDGLFLGRFAHDPEQFLKTILEIAEA